MKVEIFKSKRNKQFYFQIVAKNGEIVAASEGYKNLKDLKDTVNSIAVCIQAEGFQVVDRTKE